MNAPSGVHFFPGEGMTDSSTVYRAAIKAHRKTIRGARRAARNRGSAVESTVDFTLLQA